jgi:hypothetical protein
MPGADPGRQRYPVHRGSIPPDDIYNDWHAVKGSTGDWSFITTYRTHRGEERTTRIPPSPVAGPILAIFHHEKPFGKHTPVTGRFGQTINTQKPMGGMSW